ncbi:MAG: hypothetical protein ACTHOH_12985 [Lysobacteraceae bacterium]
MKKPIIAGLLLAATCSAHASTCESRLEGTWKSDRPASMAYLRDHASVSPKVDAFLDALLGQMTVSFGHGEVRTHMPDMVFSLDGKSTPLAGFELKKPYTVLFCDADTIAFASQSIGSDKDKLTVFHFVGQDTFWVYMGSTDPKIPDINSREFFQRTADPSN